MKNKRAFGVYLMFPGGTAEQYDSVMEALQLTEKPKGLYSHVAWGNEQGWNVTSVWENEESWNAYKEGRLDKAFQKGKLPKGNIMPFEVYNVIT